MKIKGIKIDVVNQQVTEVEFENELAGYYKLLECDTIERVRITPRHDLIVDEEGLFKEDIGAFYFLGVWYRGHGLIVGREGSTWISHRSTVESIASFTEFASGGDYKGLF